MGVTKELTGKSRCKRQVHPFVFVQEVLVYNASQENSRKERHQDTDNQCRGKSTDRTCSEIIQDDTRNDRSQIGVENGRESIGITIRQCLFHSFSRTQFFLSTLIYQDVSIHSHTQREHHTGNTGHGQGCLE